MIHTIHSMVQLTREMNFRLECYSMADIYMQNFNPS